MTDLEAVFMSFAENHDDPTPRRIWADVLDEMGLTERAAFFRGDAYSPILSMSWVEWCKRESSIYWHPKQNRPFPPTAQPLERVTLTTMPAADWHANTFSYYVEGVGRFTRVRCPTCDGSGRRPALHYPRVLVGQCPDCHGTPQNLWTCEKYGAGIVFVMPEAERQRDAAIDWSIPPEALDYNYAAAQAAYDAHRRG